MNIIGAIIGALILAMIIGAILTWPVMILFGVLAGMTGWPIAIGFWPTFVIVVIAKLLTASGSVSSD